MRISPLRYPGGKGKIYEKIKDILLSNKLDGCIFYDVFAGGSEVPLQLLENQLVSKVVLTAKCMN